MPSTEVGYLNAEWKHRSDLPRILSGETRRANTSLREVEIRDARPRPEEKHHIRTSNNNIGE